MINKYNRIAFFYYPLLKLVFGTSIFKIQKTLIHQLPSKGNLLILGGGNGEIIPEIYKTCPQLVIDFVEASSNMLSLAKKKVAPDQKVIFIHSDTIPRKVYNAYLFPFVLDCLHTHEYRAIQDQLEHFAQKDNRILVIDFYQASTLKQKCLLALSILFIKITTKYPAWKLPPVFDYFDHSKFKALNTCYLQNKFMRATIYTCSE